MKLLDSQPLTNQFLSSYMDNWESEPRERQSLIEQLITGTILIEKPSPHKIHQEMIQADSQSTFYREIHRLSGQMPANYNKLIDNLQKDPNFKMKSSGVIAIDEHIIPHSSDEIEGVDKFYSTTKQDLELGLSLIVAHYYNRNTEYPIAFQGYRRKEELQKWGKDALFKEKNEIARDLIKQLSEKPNCAALFLIDSFFMTKENVGLLKHVKKSYISRPKRSWKGSIGRQPKKNLAEWFETIPRQEFHPTIVKNPKTGKVKTYKTAFRDIYFSQIGIHRVVFIDCSEEDSGSDVIEEHAEVLISGSNRKFRVFITNELEWTAAEILSLYGLRWTIETSFRDMSQNLGFHGCKWRHLQGQYCFIALTLMSYLFLRWAQNMGVLSRYGIENRTIGQLKVSFCHYCNEQFGFWLSDLRTKCETCPMANWIYENLYIGGNG
jgi:hypothetical protein